MKKIVTLICILAALQVSAVTVSDVAGMFRGTLNVGSKSYSNKEIYVLPGTVSGSVTLVMPAVGFSSQSTDLVLTNMGLSSSGNLSAGGAAAYVQAISASSLSASAASFTMSIVTPAQTPPVTVTFTSGTKVSDKNYAITNGDFEDSWTGSEPNSGWHSFGTAVGSLASMVKSNTDQFTKSNTVRPGSTGSQSALLQSKSVVIATANGNCTSGQLNAGSTKASDASGSPGKGGNFSFSQPTNDSKYLTPFVGNPDSLVFWAKYVPKGSYSSSDNKARVRSVVTTNALYQDPESTDSHKAARIADATLNFSATSSKGWQRLAVPFAYSGVDRTSAAYVLTTFSTNATPGGGSAGDQVYLDDIEMVYNHALSTFKLNNQSISFTNGRAASTQLYSDEYPAAVTSNGKAAKSFVGYDVVNHQVHVYVVADNYSQAGGYNAYSVQMAYNTEYSYTASLCKSELPYSDENFQDLTEAKKYEKRIPNSFGGDSIIILTLNVLPTYKIEETASINMNESYSWRGNTYENLVPGEYDGIDELKTKAGCDSIYTLKLTVKAIPYEFGEVMTVCQNEAATWRDKTLQTTEAGTFTIKDELKSIYDTDSVYILTLTVLPTYSISESATIDMDKSYTWHGNTYENLTPGEYTYTDFLKTVIGGCDSVYTLTLTVNAIPYAVTEQLTVCRGEQATWHGQTLITNEAGTFTNVKDELKSIYDTDSVITLTLTVLPTYEFVETQIHYQADVVSWRGKEIKDLEARVEPYIYYDSLLTVAGCDSVYVLRLTITSTPVTYGEYSAAFCKGDKVEFAGTEYTQAFEGEVRIDEPNIYGGDSIVRLHISVLPVYTIDDYKTIIIGDDVEWEGWPLSLMPVGESTLYAYYSTVDDCDSTMILHLTVEPKPIYTGDAATSQQQKVCKQLINGQLFIIKPDETIYDILGNKIK